MDTITSKEKEQTSYLIHNNGGRPYIVYITPNTITTFFREYQSNTGTYKEEKKVLDTTYKRVFIGDNLASLPKYSKKGESRGNTILIHKNDNHYIFIGHIIYSFDIPLDDEIIEYYSPIGNSDVPYSYAVTNKETYFMLDKAKLPNELIDFKKDPYGQFYGHHLKDKKEKKKWENHISSFCTKLIHTSD